MTSGRGQVEGGKTISRSASSTFHLPPYTQAKRQGCNMFKSITLKRVLHAVQRLENAVKKQSIRISAKTTYWPFRDIYKARVAEQFINYE